MAFKKNVKNTVINIAEHWGPDKTIVVAIGTVLGAAIGAMLTIISVDNKPMDFIENNKNEEEM